MKNMLSLHRRNSHTILLDWLFYQKVLIGMYFLNRRKDTALSTKRATIIFLKLCDLCTHLVKKRFKEDRRVEFLYCCQYTES